MSDSFAEMNASANESGSTDEAPVRQGTSGTGMAVLQLLMALLVIQVYQVEQQRQLPWMLALALVTSFVLPYVSGRGRPLLITAVACVALVAALGWNALLVLGVAGLMIGISYLPLGFRVRAGLLIGVTAVLFWLRAGSADAFWTIAGSIFMFRLIVFLYETRRRSELPSLTDTLPYFFMLPNVCFALFPVVDFDTWRKSRESTLSAERLQSAAGWVVMGTVHLLIYRVIRYWFLIPPESISSPAQLLQFLTANYGLYLHVSGQFHISIGILHLFGYRLPKTHDWFFLASSFTDIWRRINIYWKDFMSRLFFMPTYFRLRQLLGDRTAICAAVGVTFLATWLAHSWQTFWLLGRFPLTWQDATLWLAAAVAVGANALLDYRKTRRHRKTSRQTFTVVSAVRHSVCVMVVFLAVSLFWAQWTNPGVIPGLLLSSGGVALWARTSVSGVLLAAVGLTCGGVILQYVYRRLKSSGFADTPRANAARSSANLALMTLLLVAALPMMRDWLPNDPARVIVTLRSGSFTQSESSRMVQGYYEELAEGTSQTHVFGPEEPNRQAQRTQQQQYFLDFTRPRNDALELELIPDFRGEYRGQAITTNSWGMRNPDIALSRPDGAYRIAVLGSSVVMGYGVGDQETFCRLLEQRLNSSDFRRKPGQRVEVLNFGVGKYTVIHQLLQLQLKVFDFEPNAVLYLCHQAELAAPGMDLARLHSERLIEDPGLLRIVRDAGVTDETPAGPMRSILLPTGPPIVRHCYRRLVGECRQRGVVPVWGYLSMPGSFPVSLEPGQIEPMAREAGFCTLDLSGWDAGVDHVEIMLSDGDPHANAAGHRLIAEAIVDQLQVCPEMPFHRE